MDLAKTIFLTVFHIFYPMASIVPGYEYDIFISYRQKDNKHDGWVAEFVTNLKGELESTFKEEISVYFDINLHDGLLETHDVDASLKEKLKCLIFIPIISRTYCDPKSFAWEHEFKAFVELVSQDQFGIKVKLPNGNVASRVLPILIHDLENADIKLCESILGGVLRGIEFIYKEPGVDKPLALEDNEKKNLNNTKYKIQIIKVAHAIKEIVLGLKTEPDPFMKGMTHLKGSLDEGVKEIDRKRVINKSIILLKSKRKLIVLLAVFLCMAGAFSVFKIIERTKQANEVTNLEKSIAVLPFINDSPNDSTTYFINGIMDEILNNLQKIKDFRVLPRISVEQFRGETKLTLNEKAKKLNVHYVVVGSGQKYGNKFVLRIQLIAAENEKYLWGKSYEQEIHETNDIINIQSQIAQSIAAELKATMTPEEKQLIEKIPTANLTAYDFYQRGREEHTKYWNDNSNIAALQKADDLYKKALEYDSTFARAYTGLAQVYGDKHYWKSFFSEDFLDSVLILANKALSFDNQLSEAYVFRGRYYLHKRKSEEAIKEFDKALEFNSNEWMAFKGRGDLYSLNNDFVKSIENYNKAISLHPNKDLPDLFHSLIWVYTLAGFRNKAVYYIKEEIKLDKDSLNYYKNLAFLEETNGNYADALYQYKRLYAMDTSNIAVLWNLGNIYVFLEKYDEALKWVIKFIEHPEYSGYVSIIGYNSIALAYWKNGYKDKARNYFDKFINNITRVNELGRAVQDPFENAYDLASVYAFFGEKEKAYEKLRLASKSQTGNLYLTMYVKNNPFFESFRDDPILKQYVMDVESKYQLEHERVRKWLEEQGML